MEACGNAIGAWLFQERQGTQCTLEFPDHEGLFNVDGEVIRYQGGRVTIDCLPKSFRIFAPTGLAAGPR